MREKTNNPISYRHSWGVTEFALLYFPGESPKIAYRRMWNWIQESRGLKEKLLAAGWRPFRKIYTPRQVECLLEHLGEP